MALDTRNASFPNDDIEFVEGDNSINTAQPYDDDEPRPDEIRTNEEFNRALATLKKHIDEGRYDM